MIKHKYYFSIILFQEIARTIFYSFLIIYVLNHGFTLDEWSYINTLSLISIFALEIPSGWFSDKFGRKKVWQFAVIFFLLSNLCYFLMDVNVLFIYPAGITYGIGFAALTGTLTSSKINEIKDNEPSYLKSFYFDKQIINYIGRTFGSIIGSSIFFYGNFNPFIISVILFAILLFYSLPYVDYQSNTGEHKIKTSFIEKVTYVKEKRLLLVFWVSICMQLVIIPAYGYWQPVIQDIAPSMQWIIVLSFLFSSSIGIIGSLFAKRFLKKEWHIFIGITLMILPLALIPIFGYTYPTIILLFAWGFGKSIYQGKFSHVKQSRIPNNRRGLAVSVFGSVGSAVGMLVLLLVGLLFNQGMDIIWIIAAFSIVYAILVFPALLVILLKGNNKIKLK